MEKNQNMSPMFFIRSRPSYSYRIKDHKWMEEGKDPNPASEEGGVMEVIDACMAAVPRFHFTHQNCDLLWNLSTLIGQ